MILQELFEAEQTPAQKYIQDVYSQYQNWPYGKGDKVMVWGSGEDQQLAPFALTTDILDKNTVIIDWLQAVPQRQGVGRRAMEELQRQAQAHGVRLKLMPWDKGQVSQGSLKRIYKKMGFKPTSKGADLMAWSPEQLDEISDERLQDYLSRANRQVDARMSRMARVRDRLNKGYEIYHAEAPNKIVDRFEANTPAEAQRYYADYVDRYESDVDYDLRLRRATGLTEAFDQPYPITWEQGDYGSYDALARLDDGSNLSINFNLESAGPEGMDEEWQVEFWRNNSLAVTGEGDAYKIFATVLEAIEQFIGEENPERVAFSASKDVEPGQNSQSRAKLYDRMVQRYAASWGYAVTRREAGDAVNYELIRKDALNEGLRDWIAALAATGAMALGMPADAAKIPHTQSVEQVSQVMAKPAAQILKKAAVKAGIVGTELAQFMAQCAHETANFTTLKEIGGKLDFKKYDPKYAPKKARALGNIKAGDGAKYAGRGYIQLTGRDNYKRAGQALGLPLEQKPELVERPDVAAKVAVWFWQNRVAPKVASFHDTKQVTKPINPGMRGIEDRQAKFNAIKQGAMATPQQLAPRGRRI